MKESESLCSKEENEIAFNYKAYIGWQIGDQENPERSSVVSSPTTSTTPIPGPFSLGSPHQYRKASNWTTGK